MGAVATPQWSDYTPTSGNINSALSRIGGFVLSTASLIGGLGLVLFLGLYLAAEPQVYLSGIPSFVPKHNDAIFDACSGSPLGLLAQ